MNFGEKEWIGRGLSLVWNLELEKLVVRAKNSSLFMTSFGCAAFSSYFHVRFEKQAINQNLLSRIRTRTLKQIFRWQSLWYHVVWIVSKYLKNEKGMIFSISEKVLTVNQLHHIIMGICIFGDLRYRIGSWPEHMKWIRYQGDSYDKRPTKNIVPHQNYEFLNPDREILVFSLNRFKSIWTLDFIYSSRHVGPHGILVW